VIKTASSISDYGLPVAECEGSPVVVSSQGILLSELEIAVEGWLLDCDIRQHSGRTLEARRALTTKLLWFLRYKRQTACGTHQLRQFLGHVTRGHEEQGGRWGDAGDPNKPRATKPVRPRTVQTYHGHLRTFFRWMVAEGMIVKSPMESITPPVARPDQVQPFTDAQIQALMVAASKSTHPRRDEAIVTFLLDTGVRAGELCGLRHKDIDLTGKRATVLGKGNKHRTVYFGRAAAKAIWNYTKGIERDPESPVFQSDRGLRKSEALTTSGLRQLIERLGLVAKIEATRCSPHTFRHYFAVSFLRNGGNVFSLQQMLGHTALAMTNRYVAYAQSDIERQHRAFSPADRLRGSRI
jgi:integrase/recombinase XerD